MNDDELNDVIARSDEEAVTFREMDVKREREAAENWRNSGGRGKPPQPLMQQEELPECYQTDEPFEVKELDDTLEGRGQRRRNIVSYNDGLSDEAWAIALEDGEDIQELTERARDRKDRRAANKLIKETEASNRGTPASDIESRARKAKKGKTKASDHEPTAGSKRKRGMKSMSVTPSLNGDDDEEHDTKRRKTKTAVNGELPTNVREQMKKAFTECHRAVLACEDETGRKRCDLFRDLPDKRDYPDYYHLITRPIALSHLRKRANSNYYKTVQAYKDDWKLMFDNARTYNQEGSWVYVDAEEMEKVFNATFDRVTIGSGLPGAPAAGSGSASGSYDSALTPMDEDERPIPVRSRSAGRKQVISDEEYLTPSDDE